MLRVLVLHGPNLNLLGNREESVYGTTTLAEIDASLSKLGSELGVELETRQSNHEGELVTWIQEARGKYHGIIINPAAYTHTSIAVRLHEHLSSHGSKPLLGAGLSRGAERRSH
ncbi:MAG: type II 3-dehydroquinate dehydratase [Nitrospira sp.]|nr:type II 3-dehydroquinate dehydratase [Nitrospira sp.]